jgi:DNA invertase Pin-like site-specific DNA recombinase
VLFAPPTVFRIDPPTRLLSLSDAGIGMNEPVGFAARSERSVAHLALNDDVAQLAHRCPRYVKLHRPPKGSKKFPATLYIPAQKAYNGLVKLVAYLRVSSEGQVDGYGLDAQRRAVRSWAKAHGHRIVHTCSDEGVSGALEASERPGLSCVLDRLSDGTAEGLIVARLDRLARSLTVQEATLGLLWRRGATVFSADTGEVHADDPDDPMRTAIRQVMGTFAELDRKMVSKRLRDGRKAKAAAGKKAVGDYAFGYCPTGKGRERDAGLNEKEQAAVARILNLRREGRSYRQIAAELDREGQRPRRADHWSAMAVRNVVKREAPQLVVTPFVSLEPGHS